MSEPAGVRYHRGSCLAVDHELRVTNRCLVKDLGLAPETAFCEAKRHPIVVAFEGQRSITPRGGKTVGPAAGALSLYHLGLGHDHRAVTWFDEDNLVVWLCAYGRHRSGQPDDAFKHFKALMATYEMMPTVDDYQLLFVDRDRRFVETVHDDAQALLALARSKPGAEQAGLVGGQTAVAVVVEAVPGLEELYVAFSHADIDYQRVIVLLAAFEPDITFGAWSFADALPTRPLRAGELETCYRTLRDTV